MYIRSLCICSLPMRIGSTELQISDTCLLRELHIMERQVTTTCRLHGFQIYAQAGYVTTTYP